MLCEKQDLRINNDRICVERWASVELLIYFVQRFRAADNYHLF